MRATGSMSGKPTPVRAFKPVLEYRIDPHYPLTSPKSLHHHPHLFLSSLVYPVSVYSFAFFLFLTFSSSSYFFSIFPFSFLPFYIFAFRIFNDNCSFLFLSVVISLFFLLLSLFLLLSSPPDFYLVFHLFDRCFLSALMFCYTVDEQISRM